MSTHAVLGVRLPDGTISGCYVHYDGDTMTPRIEDYLQRYTTTNLAVMIAKAQVLGGIRSFNCPPLEGMRLGRGLGVTEFLDNNDLYVIDESDFYDDHCGTYAWYLVDYETCDIDKRSKYE